MYIISKYTYILLVATYETQQYKLQINNIIVLKSKYNVIWFLGDILFTNKITHIQMCKRVYFFP